MKPREAVSRIHEGAVPVCVRGWRFYISGHTFCAWEAREAARAIVEVGGGDYSEVLGVVVDAHLLALDAP